RLIMKELKELSANYASENTSEMVSQIVAQAFADGYRQGYKDREDEIPVDLRDRKIEFVDLGLPSGTMWSADFEKDDNDIAYVPYEKRWYRAARRPVEDKGVFYLPGEENT
ncbi:MAG: hypothetical protein II602_02685, partial [Erysipelotrichales bacterium]|nr:hypothetical protein [Erysipelotrichales bacterium]